MFQRKEGIPQIPPTRRVKEAEAWGKGREQPGVVKDQIQDLPAPVHQDKSPALRPRPVGPMSSTTVWEGELFSMSKKSKFSSLGTPIVWTNQAVLLLCTQLCIIYYKIVALKPCDYDY